MARDMNRQMTAPRKVPKSRRNHPVEHLSSLKPGVVHPLLFAPMFREDAAVGRIDHIIEMMETKELLANQVKARISYYCVPWLAMSRFQGSRDQFDRSWMGKPKTDDEGDTVTPFFTTQVYGDPTLVPLFAAAGKHYGAAHATNTMYVEAYNLIDKWRRRNKSKELTARLLTDTTLAPAFWEHSGFEHIVPDFDQAVLQGEVALNVVSGALPVKGIGVQSPPVAVTSQSYRETGETTYTDADGWLTGGTQQFFIQRDGATNFPGIYAEMVENGITVSLANLKKAKTLQGFAEIRKQFEGHDDDAIIDKMFMAGLTVPEQWLKDPFLLDEEVVVFRQGKRYSSTAGQLDDSAVSGVATSSAYLRVPKLSVGGIIVGLLEILPDQLWERRADPFMYVTSVDDLPDALLDEADTEKVDVVTNKMIDVAHSAPGDTFGYEPMNARWTTAGPAIGGDFYKPAAEVGNTVARQRFWSNDVVDPVLTDDFYISEGGLNELPFLDDTLDPFQVQARGNLIMTGLTQFGGMLVEATGNYDKLIDLTVDDKIEKA